MKACAECGRQFICPECHHEFKGNGFDGIDSQWKSAQDASCLTTAWRLIKAGAYQRQTLTHPDVDSELIRNFLFIFARIEYALKRAGFMIKGKDEAVADWDSLANSLKGEIH